jgi:hypothetical protein
MQQLSCTDFYFNPKKLVDFCHSINPDFYDSHQRKGCTRLVGVGCGQACEEFEDDEFTGWFTPIAQ